MNYFIASKVLMSAKRCNYGSKVFWLLFFLTTNSRDSTPFLSNFDPGGPL